MGSLVAGSRARGPHAALQHLGDARHARGRDGHAASNRSFATCCARRSPRLTSLMQDLLDYGRPPDAVARAWRDRARRSRRVRHAARSRPRNWRPGRARPAREPAAVDARPRAPGAGLPEPRQPTRSSTRRAAARSGVASRGPSLPAGGVCCRVRGRRGPGLPRADPEQALRALLQPPQGRHRPRASRSCSASSRRTGHASRGATAPDGGAVFTVFLPAASGAEAGGAVAERALLLVDDEDAVRAAPGAVLRAARVRGARRRRRSRRRCDGLPAAPPDVALLDYSLPDGDGLDAPAAPARRRRVGARDDAHRARLDRPGGAGHEGRRRAVPHQAGRAARAARDGRARCSRRSRLRQRSVAGSRARAPRRADPFLGESAAIRRLAEQARARGRVATARC